MLDSLIRGHFEKYLVTPILPKISPYVSPNGVTLLSFALGIGCAFAIAWDMTLLAVVLLALSGYLDSMDGSLARFTQRSSSVGAVLDLLADRIVEAAVLIALYSLAPVDRSLTVILVLASFFICISSFLVVSLFYTQQTRNAQGKSFHYSKGLIERGETFIFFALMILLPDWFTGLAGLLAVLVVWTALFRIWQFIQQAS